MKNSKIIIVGADFQFEEKSILKKCVTSKIDAEFLLLDDLEVRIGTKTEFAKKGTGIFKSFSGNEKFIIRRSRGNFEKLVAFVEILQKRKFVFSDSFRSISTNLNKEIFLATIESKILPHPPNSFFIEQGKKVSSKNLSFPMLSKPVLGRHGENIFIHEDLNSLQKTVDETSETLIVQKCLNIEAEFRVLVVGGKILGAVRKIPETGKRIANYAAGAEFKKADLPESLLNESAKLCEAQEIDIGGVDIARDENGNYFLLEINRCPEFRAFQKATDIDVAGEIVDFILKK
ncbi:MAG: hypothetical protein OEL89_00885 [Candidatus Peregrinibacteria bacterium]|nr:hypothetical protein [Candidatus Peregrinibacteria bacterium]